MCGTLADLGAEAVRELRKEGSNLISAVALELERDVFDPRLRREFIAYQLLDANDVLECGRLVIVAGSLLRLV